RRGARARGRRRRAGARRAGRDRVSGSLTGGRMSKRLLALSTVAILIALGSGGARAQSFFEGKTIRLIVGFAPGGGFDTYARVLSRHMVRHIPAPRPSWSRT